MLADKQVTNEMKWSDSTPYGDAPFELQDKRASLAWLDTRYLDTLLNTPKNTLIKPGQI